MGADFDMPLVTVSVTTAPASAAQNGRLIPCPFRASV